MSAFLRADLLEYQRKFAEAIPEYRRAVELNKGNARRLERTYRPLVRCILASPRPDFRLAERYARLGIELRETVFSLMALARVYLHWKYLGWTHGRDVPADIDERYGDALATLEREPRVGSAHFELKAEEAVFLGDFQDAIDYMDRAIETDPRFELRSERWRLMARSRETMRADRVLNELDAARNNPEYRGNWLPFLPALAETYAIALRALQRPMGLLNTFAPELQSHELSDIVHRLRALR
jgi:tetratricopeptide (TPR) repeat protein